MTVRFAWLTGCLVAGTVVTMLLIGLAFLPVSDWEVFVPAAALAGGAVVLLAATAVEIMGRRLAQPLRRMVRSIDAGEVGPATLGESAGAGRSRTPAVRAPARPVGAARRTRAARARSRADRGALRAPGRRRAR